MLNNAATRLFGYRGELTNHTTVARWGYTVPAGKRAIIDMLFASVTRTVAGVNNAGSLVRVVASELILITCEATQLGLKRNAAITPKGICPADIYGMTQQTNTGGSTLFSVSAKITEFDQ